MRAAGRGFKITNKFMSTNATIIGDTVRRSLAEYGDKWPSRTIAGWLLEKHPLVFANFERAYAAVRYYRGAIGKKNRSILAKKDFLKPHGTAHAHEIPLPAALKDGDAWDVVPVEFGTALLLQDVHVPFHHPQAVALAIAHGRKHKVDCIILNGDIVDFYAISFWEKDPTARDLNSEVQATRLFLEHLRDQFPKARIIYKEGNHEERLWRYAWRQCPALYSLKDGRGKEILSLGSILDADNYGVEIVADKKPIRCGEHLHILHGHEFRSPFQNPVNPARGLYLRAKCNAVCGDLHQSSGHVETGLTHTVSCWSAGALCDLHPRYMPLNKWNHGFGLIHLHKKHWSFDNLKIIGGTVVGA